MFSVRSVCTYGSIQDAFVTEIDLPFGDFTILTTLFWELSLLTVHYIHYTLFWQLYHTSVGVLIIGVYLYHSFYIQVTEILSFNLIIVEL